MVWVRLILRGTTSGYSDQIAQSDGSIVESIRDVPHLQKPYGVDELSTSLSQAFELDTCR